MTFDQMKAFWDECNDQFLKFDKVTNKLSNRPDLHAFMLLDKMLPIEEKDIISAAEHDEIFLQVNIEELAKVVTKEKIMELSRCGVRFDSSNDCLAMFV